MSIEFTRWPDEFARRYREKGYWTDQPMTEILARQCQRRPDATAIICGERHISYAQFEQAAQRLAIRLTKLGLSCGDTALVQLPNCAEFYLVYFALLKMGVAPVNALFSHNRLELNAYIEQVQPRLLIAHAGHSLFAEGDYCTQLQQKAPMLDVVIVAGNTDYAQSLEALLYADEWNDEAAAFHPSAADNVAFFQLSGGSTGTPKLIPRTHNDYYYSVRASAEICQLNEHTRYLCALPAAHNYPLSSPGALGVFYAGGCVVLAPDPSAMSCFPLIKRHQITFTSLVPPAVALWLQAAEHFADDLASLQVLQVGGAKLSESLARRIPQILGCQLQQVLGMAEGLVNYTRFDDSDHLVFTTQGRPISEDDEIKVVDSAGVAVAIGEVGALVTRGPYTFRGYYRSPIHNANAFDNEGFYHSGDLVKMTEEGYLRVVGREKDQINRGGEKIAAEEIENLLVAHDDIIHAALVSMPDEIMGEKSCAFIVATNIRLKPVTLRKYLRELGVADFKLPDRFEMVASLPVTPVGKIDKKRLRQDIQDRLTPLSK
ncbi:yersiniabactin siderophore biosynthetic protein [Yersinia frederiksenii]|uniref:Yersiniabactin siderophore biosynthetic protein n=2 Tax=Yersinia frederiksenii TaxID=29484 RepID=A0A380PUV3_YERFR|nr:(2,3-dihydroxybenzoyl)adenylate synthase [Yersinia frederiksenii]ATM94435.1 2,3-dihydroxybenzoate-AMP ligase [Yersinia frederiksenii]KGA48878.1 (2,3-dihydroxybenzoyl)adenylate synthase [Yersinia frederiksenii ATCC 33641]SUP77069.1 yersiniabactin siderophore biosynthetic protein [Yersinia frederiksenii]